MKNFRYLLLAFSAILLVSGDASAQLPRTFGARRLILDNNDIIPTNNVYFVDNLGSLGINNAGNINGTFPNTNALVTLLAGGSKTTNLLIDGGATWGIDIANTNNAIRTSGRGIFGDGVGVDDATFNLGGGNFTINTLPSPALPSPLSNVLYVNAGNQMLQTPAGINILTGSGTLNTLPLWTPTGFQLGNSIITQPTTSQVVITPTGGGSTILTTNNFNASSLGFRVNANGGSGALIDQASTGLTINSIVTGITGTVASLPAVNALGASFLVTGNGGGSAVGFATNTTVVNGAGQPIGLSATVHNTSGSGWAIGVSGSTFQGAASTSNMTGGSFAANGGANGAQIVGVSGSAIGANGGPTYGGGFDAGGSTVSNVAVSAATLTTNSGSNIGVLVNVNSSTSANTGLLMNVSGPNSVGLFLTNATTALSLTGGNLILSSNLYGIGSGSTIPDGQAVVDVGDNATPLSVATVNLPVAATNGQVCFITTEDPDGVQITVGLSSVVISPAEVGKFMFINGKWRLEH